MTPSLSDGQLARITASVRDREYATAEDAQALLAEIARLRALLEQ